MSRGWWRGQKWPASCKDHIISSLTFHKIDLGHHAQITVPDRTHDKPQHTVWFEVLKRPVTDPQASQESLSIHLDPESKPLPKQPSPPRRTHRQGKKCFFLLQGPGQTLFDTYRFGMCHYYPTNRVKRPLSTTPNTPTQQSAERRQQESRNLGPLGFGCL